METGDKAGTFSKREIRLIRNCRAHSANDPAGLPGHNLILIIAKMADMLEIADKVEVNHKTLRSLKMKMRMPDKTEMFNLLTVIAALILGGGSSLPLEIIPEGTPVWAWPILIFVALVVNVASRDRIKSQRNFSESLLNKSKSASEDESLSASEALYGFMGWLTSREKEITISSTHDAAEPADLVSAFCEINNLREPRSGWANLLIHPTRDHASLFDDIEIVGDSSAGRE